MKPTRYLTTWNQLGFEGKLDCKVTVYIPGENPIIFDKGIVNYSKRHQWFDNGKTIKIITENCGSASYLRVHYAFTASYW